MEQTIRRYRSDWDLAQCGQREYGVYRSRWYRGLHTGMEWLRLSLTVSGPVLVRIYAADEEPGCSIDGLEPVLERTASDLLLSGVRGLALCFTVEPGDALQSYELTFPGLSIDSFLPAVMQGDDALRKLLGVYQSLYMDLNRRHAAFPDRLAPLAPDPLPELPRWLGASAWMGLGLPERRLLAAAAELNRLRGTPGALHTLAALVTGQDCELIEGFQWDKKIRSVQEREDCARLYGQGGAGVTLLFPMCLMSVCRDLNRCWTILSPWACPIPWRGWRPERRWMDTATWTAALSWRTRRRRNWTVWRMET